jgi:hypothetical protein
MFQCDTCGRAFSQNDALQRHKKTVHGKYRWTDIDSVFSYNGRLSTFKHWPLDFITPHSLADAGFFYTLYFDVVECAYCRGRIHSWEFEDDPLVEHFYFYRFCPLLRAFCEGKSEESFRSEWLIEFDKTDD